MAEDKKLTELILLNKANPDDLIYIVTYVEGVAVSRAITVQDLLQSTITGVNRIISGQVVWTGTGYVFRSVNLIYEINGQLYLSNGEEVTLEDPDAQDRFDNLFVDLNGLDIKEGTPSGSPAVPSLDNPDREISTNIVLVQNGESTPVEISLDTIYSENLQESGGEWDTFESTTGARIDLANTSSPINLTKDVKAIAPDALDFLNFNHSVATQIADFQTLRMKIKSLGDWKRDYIRVEFYDGVFLAGYAFINKNSFDTKDTTTIVDLYITEGQVFWTPNFVEFDAVRYFWYDGGGGSPVSSARFQLDLVKLETGGTSTKPEPDIITADKVVLKTDDFDGNLSTADDTSQKAFDTLDEVTPNQTHTGEVTGSVGLVADPTIITNKGDVIPVGADHILIYDTSLGGLRKALVSYLLGGGGDMLIATYDPTAVNSDAFDMDNMAEGTTTKILTDTERTAISNNTSKVTNATHTDEVTGSAGLTVNKVAITNKSEVTAVSGDHVLISDVSDSGNLKKVLASDFLGGSGDVSGPGSAVDENIVVFDSTTGKLIKDSGINQSAVTANTAKVTNSNHSGEVTGATALTIASDVIDRDNLADDLKKVLTNATTGATETLDWDAYSGFILTMDEACTFSDTNLPSSPDEDQITIMLTGDFAATLPTYWNVGGDTYDGTKWNLLAVECKDDTGAAEQVVCIITNLTT